MARLEMFILLAIAAVAASYQQPDWEDPFYVFKQYDTDRSGELNWIELSEMFPVPRQLIKALKLYDEDMSGTLNPLEFVKVFERYRKDDSWVL